MTACACSFHPQYYHDVDLAQISELPSLLHLDLGACNNLSDISSISRMAALQTLDISFGQNLLDVQPISCLTKLTNLKLFVSTSF